MNRLINLLAVLFLSFVSLQAERPNVLVIMADDLGYQDLGFQGSPKVKTPHLDALAEAGVIFTDAHTSASVCAPSRAGFMIGRYPQRVGFEANVPPKGKGLDVSEYTMGQAFQTWAIRHQFLVNGTLDPMKLAYL